MAENKKSFVLYIDTINTVEHLTNEQAGELFKHILEYVNDKDPQTDNIVIKLAFEPIKQALKRDLKKWERYIERQREIGKRGGRPKNPTLPEETQPFLEKPTKPVSVIDSVIVTKEREKRFAPPAPEEVINEMMKSVDDFTAMAEAGKFVDHYSSNGWKVGKNSMKDWKSAVRNWLRNRNTFTKTQKEEGPQNMGTYYTPLQ